MSDEQHSFAVPALLQQFEEGLIGANRREAVSAVDLLAQSKMCSHDFGGLPGAAQRARIDAFQVSPEVLQRERGQRALLDARVIECAAFVESLAGIGITRARVP